MIVDGQRVAFDGEKNVLSVIRKAGIDMPTFCYYSDLSVYGACRMCIVEDEKTGKIDASCSMEPRDGMCIRTNSAKLLKHRRMILELLLASHNNSMDRWGDLPAILMALFVVVGVFCEGFIYRFLKKATVR